MESHRQPQGKDTAIATLCRAEGVTKYSRRLLGRGRPRTAIFPRKGEGGSVGRMK